MGKERKMAKTNKQPATLEYLGQDIILTGGDDSKNEIFTLSHTYQDGSSETIGLRLDVPYKVGGKDVNGMVIKDWVYEAYLRSDLNRNRVKSVQERESDGNDVSKGDLTKDISI